MGVVVTPSGSAADGAIGGDFQAIAAWRAAAACRVSARHREKSEWSIVPAVHLTLMPTESIYDVQSSF